MPQCPIAGDDNVAAAHRGQNVSRPYSGPVTSATYAIGHCIRKGTYILHGSVATRLGCGGIFNEGIVVTHFLLRLTMKEFLNQSAFLEVTSESIVEWSSSNLFTPCTLLPHALNCGRFCFWRQINTEDVFGPSLGEV